jgi:hypothetical protein
MSFAASLAAGLVSLLAGAGVVLGAWAQAAGAARQTGGEQHRDDETDQSLHGRSPFEGTSLTDAEQLHLEDQGGAGRDHPAGPAIAVAQMRGDDQLALASHLHRDDAFVPALDHAALAHRELERAAAVHRAVELLAALEPAGVVHAHGVAGLGPGAGALHQVHVAEPGGGLDDLCVALVAHDGSFGAP